MKKTIIALLALASVEVGSAEPTSYTWNTEGFANLGGTVSGTYNTTTYTPNQGTYAGQELTVLNSSSYQETGINTLYNWINDAMLGKSTFVIEGNISIGTATGNVTLVHIGRAGIGLTLGVNGSNLVLTNGDVNSGTSITLGSISVNSSASDNWYMTDFYVSIGKDGVVKYSIGGADLTLASTKFTTTWVDGTTPAGGNSADYAVEQNYRYSIGFKAPGWQGNSGLSNNFTTTGITISTHTIPEPATATLSLLALAGLAARRRRK